MPAYRVELRKGRGAVSNLQGRFERDQRETFDDGWAEHQEGEPDAGALPPRLVTQVSIEQARSILSRNASPDIPFGVSLNPYRGCEHVMRHCSVFTDCSTLNLGLEVY